MYYLNFRYEDEEETICRLSQGNEALIEIAAAQASDDENDEEMPEWFSDSPIKFNQEVDQYSENDGEERIASYTESVESETPEWYTDSPIRWTQETYQDSKNEVFLASDVDNEGSEAPEWYTNSPIRWAQDNDHESENTDSEPTPYEEKEVIVENQNGQEQTDYKMECDDTINMPLAPPSTPTSASFR